MTRRKKIEDESTFLNRKASQARNSWLTRAKKLGIDKSEVPTKQEILVWLIEGLPFKCYLSNSEISKNLIELDHKLPISRGGSFKLDNIGVTSKWYNKSKGDLNEKEFRSLLKLISDWDDKGKSLLSRLVSSGRRYGKR